MAMDGPMKILGSKLFCLHVHLLDKLLCLHVHLLDYPNTWIQLRRLREVQTFETVRVTTRENILGNNLNRISHWYRQQTKQCIYCGISHYNKHISHNK
jgi:hypothetical protein